MRKDSIETIKEKDYNLIIFDCDGTLVDSEFLSNSVVASMIRELGIDLSDALAYKTFSGTSMPLIIDFIEDKLGKPLDFDFEAAFRPRVQKVFEDKLQPMADVLPFLDQLSIDRCVASNGPRIKMETTLSVTGLDKYFAASEIFSAYDIQKWKPAPDLFLHTARNMGYETSQCLVIEDSLSGVQAAKNAGIDVIAIKDAVAPESTTNFEVPVFENFRTLHKTFF